MTAFNVVRFRVKPEGEQAFLDLHKKFQPKFAGMRRFSLFKIGDLSYCVIGEWASFDHIAAARPQLVGLLDSIRHHLVDLGAGLGVTDPVSGTVVVDKSRKGAAKPKSKPRAKATVKKKSVKKVAKELAKREVKKAKVKRGKKR